MALDTYISLTIGDGLVTQLPALLISTATGIIVTRAISDASFGTDIQKQFTAQHRPYWIAAGFLAVLAFLPGLPLVRAAAAGRDPAGPGLQPAPPARAPASGEGARPTRRRRGRRRPPRRWPPWCRWTRCRWSSATG